MASRLDHHGRRGALAALLVLLLAAATSAEVGSPGSYPPNKCAQQNLAGTCNGCVCCCVPRGEKQRLFPSDACTCARPSLGAAETSARLTGLVLGGGGLILACLLSACWFGEWCCGASPFYERAPRSELDEP